MRSFMLTDDPRSGRASPSPKQKGNTVENKTIPATRVVINTKNNIIIEGKPDAEIVTTADLARQPWVGTLSMREDIFAENKSNLPAGTEVHVKLWTNATFAGEGDIVLGEAKQVRESSIDIPYTGVGEAQLAKS